MVLPRLIPIAALVSLAINTHGFDPSQQDDSLALVRHFKVPEKPLEMPKEGGLIGDDVGLTVSLMGGTDVFRMQEFGFFEFYLQVHAAEQTPRVRNLGWPGDTVYRQQRPMYFFMEEGDTREGSEPDGREKIEPGVFILSYGKMESLDGLEKLEDFEEAYDRLIVELKKLTHRIALLEPIDFIPTGPAAELVEDRNRVLEKYKEMIEKLAFRRKVLLVPSGVLTIDNLLADPTGIHPPSYRVSQRDLLLAARVSGGGSDLGQPGDVQRKSELRRLILEKNYLWDQYYRPTNWAFLYGDRQHVPSSRHHKDSDRRWFVEELNRIPALIFEKENEIWAVAKEVGP